MRIVVAGATGLLGRALCRALIDAGHETTALVRNVEAARRLLPPDVSLVQWDLTVEGEWENCFLEAEAVVNLAGAPLDGQRWSPAYKGMLRSSRIDTTHAIVRAWRDLGRLGGVLLNASAVGYYGDCGEATVTEECRRGDGFLPELCADWEAEALKAQEFSVRVVLLRTGLVLSAEGGMLSRMVPMFRWFLGGPLGNGRQWMPWIHIEDHIRMVLWLLEERQVSGPVNLCAPYPVRMSEFAASLGAVLRRPALMAVPSALVRLVVGEMADTILASQRVVPDVASGHGFRWRYPRLEPALRALLVQRRV